MTATNIDWTTDAKGIGQYAEVNGINLYYETHGTGRPLILLLSFLDQEQGQGATS